MRYLLKGFKLLLLSLMVSQLPMLTQAGNCEAFKDTRIGYVNYRKLRSSAPQIPQIREKLTREFEPQRKKIVALRKTISELLNQYDSAISESDKDPNDKNQQAINQLQKDIDEKQVELTKLQQRIQNEVTSRRNEEMTKLQNLIIHLVAKVAKEKQLVYVQNETAVIYVNSCIDISPDVFNYLSEQGVE